MGISPSDYQAMQARTHRAIAGPTLAAGKAADIESDLHQQIMDECDRRGWLYFHGAMCRRTSRTLGEPDFIILRSPKLMICPVCWRIVFLNEVGLCCGEQYKPIPELLLVECKARKKKQSDEQLAIAAHAHKLGHTVHVVRSIEEFLKL